MHSAQQPKTLQQRLGKDETLVVHSERPLNAEPPVERLATSLITPTRLFFVRNHGDVPDVDVAAYRLTVDGLVDRPLKLSLAALRERFEQITLAATLSCAGNRRAQLMELAPIPGELAWSDGAIATAMWTGVRLADVLASAKVARGALHVEFEGLSETSNTRAGVASEARSRSRRRSPPRRSSPTV